MLCHSLLHAPVVACPQVENTKAERAILQQLQHPFLMNLRYAFQVIVSSTLMHIPHSLSFYVQLILLHAFMHSALVPGCTSSFLRCASCLQSKEKLYLVLDYFQGGELFFHLRNQRRFTEEVVRLWIAEIALALGHLHSMGVIYRDLKPENVLLDDDGN